MASLVPKNVHQIERIARAIIGILGISLVFIGPKTMWGLIGIVPLATALLGTCPAYTLLGISTCKIKTDGSKS